MENNSMFVRSNNAKSTFVQSVLASVKPEEKKQQIIKVAVELGVPLPQTRIPANLISQLNKAISAISTHDSTTYYESLPLNTVSDVLKASNITLLDEDDTPLEFVMLTGREGKATFNLSLGGAKVINSMLVVTWHKMESGRYEFLAYLS